MAVSLSNGVHPLVASDLIVRIVPPYLCRYCGTLAQLQAEGLIPAGLQLPTGKNRVHYEDERFDYELQRTRVPGTKGPMSVWINGDYWMVDVSVKGRKVDWRIYQIQAKQSEIAELQRCASPEWNATWQRAYAAKQDTNYMAFRTQLLGDMAPRKRGRPAATPATKAQGAANV